MPLVLDNKLSFLLSCLVISTIVVHIYFIGKCFHIFFFTHFIFCILVTLLCVFFFILKEIKEKERSAILKKMERLFGAIGVPRGSAPSLFSPHITLRSTDLVSRVPQNFVVEKNSGAPCGVAPEAMNNLVRKSLPYFVSHT